MPLETEIKYIDVDHEAVRRRLAALGARRNPFRFERNAVLDDAQRSLRGRGVLLRLRYDGENLLTLKTPASGPQGLKVRHEHETRFEDFDAAMRVFENLGYGVAFWYEKLRETWEYGGCHICLDLLPFGSFAEIEGEPEAIRQCAVELGLDAYRSSDANYHSLNAQYRKRAGLPEQDGFAFDEAERQRLMEIAGS
ncbi:adenylate cyclase class 2 [Desulfobaculum xiamenense]|uniref:Adenylate cyclase class 2 n=1 Tax=Desulfobaculum xiamenense TaxID=995050 RepID=A0A846QME5_9BACT|nr:class IV adenylate cyclase [Desulfobaculum xiamenense]NJB66605.1 adenylate cyclase class 2 [Desulfobaculum xiamenense]